MADSYKKYLSKEKHEELLEELENLKTKKRKEIAEKLEFAKSLGDLSENAEYHEARDEQAKVEERIMDIETTLKVAEIVKSKGSGIVTVGSKVVIHDDKKGAEKTWEIVGSEETDLPAGKISNESPLGQKLLGKKVGDTIEIQTPKGKISYKVTKIH
jgi:transcription elongation factor GreA